MALEQIPTSVPPGVFALIQKDYLQRKYYDALRPHSYYRNDANRKRLEPHTGQTATWSKLGFLPVDLLPLPTALANPPEATFSTEQFSAKPLPYGQSFRVDGPTLYAQGGDYVVQGTRGLAEWAGRTQCRIARGKLFSGYLGGTSIVRRAQVTGNTVLLLNSLSGFRFANGATGLVPVSATTPLAIQIGAAANTVTGTTPINENFPDGPGIVTLGTALGANVAAQTVVTAENRPFIVRAGDRTSTETITATDACTVQMLLIARERLSTSGIPPHEDGTYHLHVDASFFVLISKDDQWKTATQGMGPSPAFGNVGQYLPALNLTIFESNDSPRPSAGEEVQVGSLTGGPGGSTGVEPSGAAGTPGQSRSMRDIGADVKNSNGINIRRFLMTGREILIETYVDQTYYWGEGGIRTILQISPNVAEYQMASGSRFVAGEVDGWLMLFQPAMDPRALQTVMTVSSVFDYTLTTDLFGETGGNNGLTLGTRVPLKRAVVGEYGYTF